MSSRSHRIAARRVSCYAVAATRLLYFAISRDLRRAALFLWITSLSATRSSTLTASSVAAFGRAQRRQRRSLPRPSSRTCALLCVAACSRSRRRSVTRIRFFDDFELANPENPFRKSA